MADDSALCLLPSCSRLAAPAFADLTAFLGRATSRRCARSKGFGIGTGLLIVGFEFEFADTSDGAFAGERRARRPALKTYMFNGLLQTPVPIARMQFYGTVGGGLYHETLSSDPADDQTTSAPTSAAARRSA